MPKLLAQISRPSTCSKMGGVALGDTLVDGSAADCGAEGEACLGAEVLEAGFGEAPACEVATVPELGALAAAGFAGAEAAELVGLCAAGMEDAGPERISATAGVWSERSRTGVFTSTRGTEPC
jgi:hypothetical protein